MLWAVIIGIGFLIAGFMGAKGLGEKAQYGCMIFILVVLVLVILFVALLTNM